MSRTKREHDLKQRKKRFVPKGARRQKRFYDEVAMAEAGVVVSRAHGRGRILNEMSE